MTNIYINRMKRIMEQFLEEQKRGNAEIANNREFYLPEVAEQKNAEIKARQNQQYVNAIVAIEKIFDNLKDLLSRAGFPNTGFLTTDRLFFESQMSLTPAELQGFVERYESTGNFTMLRLLHDYLQKQPESLQLNVVMDQIHLPDEQLKTYKWFCEESLKILFKIHKNSLILDNPLEIQLFDDPTLINIANRLSVIGDGSGLNKYRDVEVPSSVLHQYDSYVLKAHDISAKLFDREA